MKRQSTEFIHGNIPHRFPMLLVDAVEQLSAGRGRASKLISADDECCERFGDGPPALPFTLVVDALGQVATMVLRAQDPAAASVWYLGSIESMTFHSPVLAGSVLQMEARILRRFQNTARIEVIALSEGMPVADGLMVLSQGGSTRDANR